MSYHKNSPLGDQHILHNWEYADAAARTGATGLVSADVGKACKQMDTLALYVLTNHSPVTWATMGGGGGGGTGDVVGPGSSTDNAVARFDTTTGKLIQNSSVTISDGGDLTAGKYNTVTISGSSTPTLAVTGTTTVSGANTGDQVGDGSTITGSGTGGSPFVAVGISGIATADLTYLKGSDIDRQCSGLAGNSASSTLISIHAGNTSIDVGSGYGYVNDHSGSAGTYKKVTFSGASGVSTAGDGTNYIAIDSSGNVNVALTKQSMADHIFLGHCYCAGGYVVEVFNVAEWTGHFQGRINEFISHGIKTIVADGLAVTEQATPLKLYVSAGEMYTRLSEIAVSAPISTFLKMYNAAGTWAVDSTNANYVNVTQWNDITSGLVTMTGGYWKKDLLLITPSKNVYYIFGQAEYATSDAAKTGILPVIPDAIRLDSAFLAAIVCQKGDTSIGNRLNNISPNLERIFGYGTVGGGVAIHHGDLIGLGDDDHTQYLNNTRGDARYVLPTVTVNGKALSSNITLALASADYANQGTTSTVLHGNASGNPSFGVVALGDMATIATKTYLGNTTGGAAVPTAVAVTTLKTDLALAKADVGLGSVENTALTTWTGNTSITSVGTIATGTWNAAAIADGKIASALTGKTYNALSLTAAANGFTIAGGTVSKTMTFPNTLTISGTDASTLNVGSGGTLGTAAYTATGAYDASGAAASAVSTHAALQTGIHGISITAAKVLSVSETMTLAAGGIGQTYTMPSSSKTLMATDYSNAGTAPTWNQNTTGSSGLTVASVTFTNTGGAAAGATFNGSAAKTIDYSTLGAAASSHTHAESAITFTDITTNNVSNTIHGYFPKVTGTPGQFVKVNAGGTGLDYATISGGGDMLGSNNLSDVANKQTAINTVTQVSTATNEYVLTKDTGTGNALWKAASAGGGGDGGFAFKYAFDTGTGGSPATGTFQFDNATLSSVTLAYIYETDGAGVAIDYELDDIMVGDMVMMSNATRTKYLVFEVTAPFISGANIDNLPVVYRFGTGAVFSNAETVFIDFERTGKSLFASNLVLSGGFN